MILCHTHTHSQHTFHFNHTHTIPHRCWFTSLNRQLKFIKMNTACRSKLREWAWKLLCAWIKFTICTCFQSLWPQHSSFVRSCPSSPTSMNGARLISINKKQNTEDDYQVIERCIRYMIMIKFPFACGNKKQNILSIYLQSSLFFISVLLTHTFVQSIVQSISRILMRNSSAFDIIFPIVY